MKGRRIEGWVGSPLSPAGAVPWVLLGALLGTALRVGGVLAFAPTPGEIPWITLTENLSGAFALGLLAPLLERVDAGGRVTMLVGTGLLGSYTTFSALALEGVGLFAAGAAGAALIYLGLSLLMGPPLALAGWWIAERMLPGKANSE